MKHLLDPGSASVSRIISKWAKDYGIRFVPQRVGTDERWHDCTADEAERWVIRLPNEQQLSILTEDEACTARTLLLVCAQYNLQPADAFTVLLYGLS